jgi:hypothetical protein
MVWQLGGHMQANYLFLNAEYLAKVLSNLAKTFCVIIPHFLNLFALFQIFLCTQIVWQMASISNTDTSEASKPAIIS